MDDEQYFESEQQIRQNLADTYDGETAEQILPELRRRIPGLLDTPVRDVVDTAYEVYREL